MLDIEAQPGNRLGFFVSNWKVGRRGVGWVERSETQHRAISFQPSAISRSVWVFGAASSSAGGSKQSVLVGMALAVNVFVLV
ncbi:hypothetical protein CWC25_17170 [Pseudoalteromonas sp. S4389]|nr:hypothetical protein CWC25_17170 [Pseudoalteromonas sp. S4389]